MTAACRYSMIACWLCQLGMSSMVILVLAPVLTYTLQTAAPTPATASVATAINNRSAPYCESHILSVFNQSAAYDTTGYTLSVVWQPSFDPVWQQLGCLASLAALIIIGATRQLPGAWANNASFTNLQLLDVSGQSFSGQLSAIFACTVVH